MGDYQDQVCVPWMETHGEHGSKLLRQLDELK